MSQFKSLHAPAWPVARYSFGSRHKPQRLHCSEVEASCLCSDAVADCTGEEAVDQEEVEKERAEEILSQHGATAALSAVSATARNRVELQLLRIMSEEWMHTWGELLSSAAKCPTVCQLPSFISAVDQAIHAVEGTSDESCSQEVLDDVHAWLLAWRRAMQTHAVRC